MDLSERLATSRVARDLAYRQLDAQLRAFDSFDFKAAGLLGLDGAGLAAILAAKDTFGGGWWYPALGVLVSAVFALFGIVHQNYDLGPDAAPFYIRTQDLTEADSNGLLVTELAITLHFNEGLLRRKSAAFTYGLRIVVLTGFFSSLVALIK